MAALIATGTLPDQLIGLIQSVEVVFDNKQSILFELIKDTIKNLELKAKTSSKYKGIISDLKAREGSNYKKFETVSFGLTSFDNLEITLEELHNLLTIDVISTFDNRIPNMGKRQIFDTTIGLDADIQYLQRQYLNYQLNISHKAFEILSKNNGNAQEDMLKIRKQQTRFLEIIDHLFKDTDKKINRKENEITFICHENEITTYQLSTGEKQVLIILLTALVQDNKPSIIFMDEPEISLHFDWQKKLIQYIREINPNAQIILATHSPAVIIEGWRDKVKDVRDLIVADTLKAKK